MLKNTLKTLGLNDNEIEIYLTLITLGSAPASVIGKRANIERSHTIYLCKRLVKKGFITFIEKNKTFIFTPVPPKELLKITEKEKKQVEDKETKLHQIIGELQNMINPNAALPKIQFFEGVDGMINIYKDMLKENKDIYDCNMVDRTYMHEDVINYWTNEYMPQREKMTNRSFSLYNRQTGKDEYTKYDKKVRRITLFLSQEDFPFRSQILIYGKKVAFCSLAATDLTGAIIENEAIWETQFSMFRLAWNYARTLPQNQAHRNVVI
jgi:HTH-type transcriptional regulator, sugar sensing transcriptional regulator